MCIVEKSQSRIQRGDAPKSFPHVKSGLKRFVDWIGTTSGSCRIPKSFNASLVVVHKMLKHYQEMELLPGLYYNTLLN
jgi:hypothetical protein